MGSVITINREPYAVIKAEHHKMGRGGAVLKTKLRNLISGNVIEKTWQGNDKAEEAAVEKRKADFLYQDGNLAYFMDNDNFEQFTLDMETIGEQAKFMKDGINVTVLHFEEKPMTIELPIKVELKVTSAPPGVRGNSAGNVMKTAELETGVEISVPMFVNTDDMIRVNTQTGEYVERV